MTKRNDGRLLVGSGKHGERRHTGSEVYLRMLLCELPGSFLSQDLRATVGIQRVMITIDEILPSRLAITYSTVRKVLLLATGDALFSVSVLPVKASLCEAE